MNRIACMYGRWSTTMRSVPGVPRTRPTPGCRHFWKRPASGIPACVGRTGTGNATYVRAMDRTCRRSRPTSARDEPSRTDCQRSRADRQHLPPAERDACPAGDDRARPEIRVGIERIAPDGRDEQRARGKGRDTEHRQCEQEEGEGGQAWSARQLEFPMVRRSARTSQGGRLAHHHDICASVRLLRSLFQPWRADVRSGKWWAKGPPYALRLGQSLQASGARLRAPAGNLGGPALRCLFHPHARQRCIDPSKSITRSRGCYGYRLQ